MLKAPLPSANDVAARSGKFIGVGVGEGNSGVSGDCVNRGLLLGRGAAGALDRIEISVAARIDGVDELRVGAARNVRRHRLLREFR
jgi:hypothetical protein